MFKIVSIEGNIGSGKSTLLENLKKHYKDKSYVIFLKEPVDDWEKIKDNQGNTMLQKFYGDQEKYSFAFQMMAYISRLKILRDTVKVLQNHSIMTPGLKAWVDQVKQVEGEEVSFSRLKTMANQMKEVEGIENKYVIITERSLYTDKYVFAKMLHDQGKIEDVCYQIYLNWFDEFANDFPISHSVYVNAEPQKCYERIHIRAREGEELIPLTYLEQCHNYHEEFLANTDNKLVLDGNVNIYENEKIVKHWLEEINAFINLSL
jgi:deoxyadenosine/deoxycytidine kinase